MRVELPDYSKAVFHAGFARAACKKGYTLNSLRPDYYHQPTHANPCDDIHSTNIAVLLLAMLAAIAISASWSERIWCAPRPTSNSIWAVDAAQG